MYTLQYVYRSLLTIPFPLISRKWVTNRSKMAGYTFCTPLVPQWGTYFYIPSILYNKSTPMYPTFWGTLGYTFSSYHISPACVFISKYSSRTPFPIFFPLYIVFYMPTFHVNGFEYNKNGGIQFLCLTCASLRHIFSNP